MNKEVGWGQFNRREIAIPAQPLAASRRAYPVPMFAMKAESGEEGWRDWLLMIARLVEEIVTFHGK